MGREIGGKVILITGASSGIGRETALVSARARARVMLVARREGLLQTLQKEVADLGGKASYRVLDLTRRENVEKMIRETREEFGRIDVLINNAGFGFFGTIENTPESVVQEMFALNFDAALVATQLAIPIMRQQQSGHIINISSVVGKRGLPLSGIYSATKFALDGLTQALRLELKGSGIHVSIVNPAATQTEFSDHVRHGDVTSRFKPLGRVQSAEEVAKAIVECIRNPKIEVYPYRLSRLFVWFNTLAPSILDRLLMSYLRDRIRAKSSA